MLRRLVRTYRRLSSLAAERGEIGAVVELLADELDAEAWVVGTDLGLLGAAAPGLDPLDARQLVQKQAPELRLGSVLGLAAQTRLPVRSPEVEGGSVVVTPVVVDGEVVAYLLVRERPGRDRAEDLSLLVAEHAATICGLTLGRERVVAAAAGRVRDDLMEGILLGRAGDPEELQRWGRHLGWDPALAYRVVLLQGDGWGGQPARVRSVIEHFGKSRSPHCLIAAHDDELVIIAPERDGPDGPSPAGLAAECIAYAKELFAGVSLVAGVSSLVRTVEDVAGAYVEARRTTQAAARIGRRGQVVCFEDLGIHRLLLQVPDLTALRAFADEVLGELEAYEQTHDARWLETLAVFFQENGNLQRVARRLHVHPNTVVYRLRRIGEISGLDLESYQHRLEVQVALAVLELLGDPRQ